MYISVYNLFYTSLPVLALGVFEQDVNDRNSILFPKLYTPGLKNALFNTTEFIKSVLHGVFSSLILFLIPYGTYKDGISPKGFVMGDHQLLASVLAIILILDNTAQIALDTTYWTVFNHITIWGSFVSYIILDYFYNYVIGGPYVGALTEALKDPNFWFTTIICVIILMVPILAARFYFADVLPSLSDKVKEIKKYFIGVNINPLTLFLLQIRMKQRMSQLRSRHSSDVLRTPSARRARRSLRSGYAFAHQEGFGRLITSGKIMRKLPKDFAVGLGKYKQNSGEGATATPSHSKMTAVNNGVSAPMQPKVGSPPTILNLPGSSQIPNDQSPMSPRAPTQDLDTINL